MLGVRQHPTALQAAVDAVMDPTAFVAGRTVPRYRHQADHDRIADLRICKAIVALVRHLNAVIAELDEAAGARVCSLQRIFAEPVVSAAICVSAHWPSAFGIGWSSVFDAAVPNVMALWPISPSLSAATQDGAVP